MDLSQILISSPSAPAGPNSSHSSVRQQRQGPGDYKEPAPLLAVQNGVASPPDFLPYDQTAPFSHHETQFSSPPHFHRTLLQPAYPSHDVARYSRLSQTPPADFAHPSHDTRALAPLPHLTTSRSSGQHPFDTLIPLEAAPSDPSIYDHQYTENSMAPTASRKRPRTTSDTSDGGRPFKRRQTSRPSSSRGHHTHASTDSEATIGIPLNQGHQPSRVQPSRPPETIDLSQVDDEEDLPQVLSQQVADAVQPQNTQQPVRGTKLSALICTVCLDEVQDVTTTVCGHAFCRLCLLNWLKQGEQQHSRKSSCPACRKPLKRNDKNHVITLEIMTRPRGTAGKARQSAS